MKKKDYMQEIEDLFKLYYNDAYFYIYSLSKDTYLSEDIVMDAFYKAISKKNKDFSNFKSWLLKVCRNSYFDYLKKNKKIESLIIESVEDFDPIIEKMIVEERNKSLYMAINLLSDIEKECINLYYFENLSIRDISKIVEKSEDNVKVILMRSRKTLKNILKGDSNYEF